jgi:hypothetical protein
MTTHRILPVWINRGPHEGGLNISTVERVKNALYVGDFCLKTRAGEWSDEPAAVFFNETPPEPHYSQYFGLFQRSGSVFITNAISAATGHWSGLLADDGEIIYSRFRHDFRASTDGSVMVDGGRDYQRMLGKVGNPRVRLSIIRERIVVNDVLFLPVSPPAGLVPQPGIAGPVGSMGEQ